MDQLPAPSSISGSWIFGLAEPASSRASARTAGQVPLTSRSRTTSPHTPSTLNGATAVFITTTGETPGTNRLEITGTMGKMVAEGTTLTFWKNEVDGAEWCRDCSRGFDKPKCEKIEYHFETRRTSAPGYPPELHRSPRERRSAARVRI